MSMGWICFKSENGYPHALPAEHTAISMVRSDEKNKNIYIVRCSLLSNSRRTDAILYTKEFAYVEAFFEDAETANTKEE
jgi:hypothetical protein